VFSFFLLFAAVNANSYEESWTASIFSDLPSKPSAAGLEVIKRMMEKVSTWKLTHPEGLVGTPSEYPYLSIIPQFKAYIIPDVETPVVWQSRCFASNSAVATSIKSGSIGIAISSWGKVSDDCSDEYKFSTVANDRHVKIDTEGTYNIVWNLPSDARDAEKWDLATKGVRVFNFMLDMPTTIANLLETGLLFVPEFTKNVDPVSAKRNVDFMARWPQFSMESRDPLSGVPPPAELVHSGDYFAVIRLDGLDPLLAFGMGSTTGHAVTSIWIDGELYICESTVDDSYWPTNGIQRTPYKQWLKQAEEAGYNVVWAPLSKKARLQYNETAAVQFFLDHEGLDYGYRNMLWGWVDTLYNNYPCMPPDYSSICLQWEFIEVMFGTLERLAPEMVEKFAGQAFNLRLGTSGLKIAELYQEAASRGIDSRVIPTMPEQDSWLYATTKNDVPVQGRSMVCCVFVCATWKAAGLFGDNEVNCGEFTNVDDYSMDFLDEEPKQILGRWTLELNDYRTKSAYPHMNENCASLAPNFEKDPKC